MKIAIVCDVLGKENNGTTIAAMNLIRFLQERGHEVRILCCDKDKTGQAGYYVSPTMNLGIFNNYVAKNGVSLAKPDDEVIRTAFTEKGGVDVVHVMLPFNLGVRAEKIAKEMNLPVSVGCHQLAENISTHVFMQNFRLVNNVIYKHFKKFYVSADTVHYVTPYLQELYEKKFGKTNGYAISNGVADTFFPAESTCNTSECVPIVFTGRYSREKSHDVLIKAIALSKYKDRIKLVLPGTGPLQNKIEKRCKKLAINAQLGFVNRDEMPNLLRSCYLYVHAAEIEAEGIGCLEAISCGVVPIINDSPRCATKSYAMGNYNTFKNRNAKDLASKIDYWIEHEEAYEIQRKKYIQSAAQLFSRKVCMEKMEKMFLDTIEKHAQTNA